MNDNRELLKKLIVYSIRTFIQGAVITLIAAGILSLFSSYPFLSFYTLVLVLLNGLGTTVAGVSNFFAYGKPFREIERFINEIASGDLKQDIRLEHLGPLKRFGVPMNVMRESLNELVSEVKRTSAVINKSIGDLHQQIDFTQQNYERILSNMKEVDVSMQGQSLSAQESAQAVDEMAHGISQISETSTVASESSSQVGRAAVQTRSEMAEMNNQMKRIRESFQGLSHSFSEFTARTADISGFVETIRDISGQTNLLALNASIEAARAGEEGLGFAVVASEVRKLSNQTGETADKISTLIEVVQTNAVRAVDAMKLSEQEIQKGMNVVSGTEQAIRLILESVDQIDSRIQEISSVGFQMAAGSEEVAATVDDMAKSSRQSSQNVSEVTSLTQKMQSSMNEVSQAARQLHEMGESLSELMNRFKL